jgi:hypothetical protein
MVLEEIHNPLPEDPSQGRVAGFPLLHLTALSRTNQQVHLKIRLHTAGTLITQKDLVDGKRLGHYVLELCQISVGKPPAERIKRLMNSGNPTQRQLTD